MKRATQSALKGAKVLILEDEYFLADDLARALRDAGAQPVGPVNTVQQAEELVASESPDAAILDLNLRGEMASDFVERLSTTDVRCVIVSGYAIDAFPELVCSAPRLEKPVSPAFVVDSLAAELARAR